MDNITNINKKDGFVYVVSAPSGTGKTSLLKALLLDRSLNINLAISHTTRVPREGETDGKDYYFINNSKFINMIKNADFIEYAKVFNNYYGTSKLSVESIISQGKNIVLEIDWQGAKQVRKIFKSKCISIFILPPSFEILEQRLKLRGQDSSSIIRERMRDAKTQQSQISEYEHIIINDCFQDALKDLKLIFQNSHYT